MAMRSLSPKVHTLFARITDDTWTELNRAARREGFSSVSELVRTIVADYLTKLKRNR